MSGSEEKTTSPLLSLDTPGEQHPEKSIVVETPDEEHMNQVDEAIAVSFGLG